MTEKVQKDQGSVLLGTQLSSTLYPATPTAQKKSKEILANKEQKQLTMV
jgi:hypothetical protein